MDTASALSAPSFLSGIRVYNSGSKSTSPYVTTYAGNNIGAAVSASNALLRAYVLAETALAPTFAVPPLSPWVRVTNLGSESIPPLATMIAWDTVGAATSALYIVVRPCGLTRVVKSIPAPTFAAQPPSH